MSQLTAVDGKVHITLNLTAELPKKAGQERNLILINRDSEYYAAASNQDTVEVGKPGVQEGQGQVVSSVSGTNIHHTSSFADNTF